MRTLLVMTLALAMIMASDAASAETRFGFDAHGGWNGYGMGALNDTLSSFNRDFGTALAPIRQGGSWGLGLHLWPDPNVRLRFGYENLMARSEDSGVRFDLGVQALTLGVTWFTPPARWARYGAGIALGPHYANGGFHAPGASFRSSGYGFGGHVAAEVLVPVRNGWSLDGALGYRLASIDGVKLGGTKSALRPSYDGWMLRVGIALDPTP